MLRRIASFEDRHGRPIFDKTSRGYTLPPGRTRFLEAAREVESAIHGVSRVIQGEHSPLSGTVRLTSTDTFCMDFLPKVISEQRKVLPDLKVELICNNSHVDLARMDADMVLRPASTLPADQTGRPCADLVFSAYSADRDLKKWVGMRGPISNSWPADWMSKNVSPDEIAGWSDSFVVLAALLASGLGKGYLPRYLGDRTENVSRLAHYPEFRIKLWVATHHDLADIPRIKAVQDYLCSAVSAQAHLFSGEE